MTKFLEMAKCYVTSTGTGPVGLGTAVPGFKTPVSQGLVDGDIVSYCLDDVLNAREVSWGVVSGSGLIISRNLISSTSGSLLVLTSSATLAIVPTAREFSQNEIDRWGGW